jgi:integrase
MGIYSYEADGKKWWGIDVRYKKPDGSDGRIQQRRIPTKEQATSLEAKVKAEAFEGRFFDKRKVLTLSVQEAWELYKPAGQENDSFNTDEGRAKHLIRHLGQKQALGLTVAEVDDYRRLRRLETTVRGGPPTPGTLDRELELLKRVLNYAVAAKRLESHPLKDAKFLRVPNVRRSVVDPEAFQRLWEKADADLKPIALVAYDTGMREREVLDLTWGQVDLREGAVRLSQQDTKGEEARLVILSSRTVEALKGLPEGLPHTAVFRNPATGLAWQDIRKKWTKALEAAGLQGAWFHDLRRSFVTKMRRVGVPESTVMKMSGHRTRAVFERYNIVDDRDLRQAMAKADELVNFRLKPVGDAEQKRKATV